MKFCSILLILICFLFLFDSCGQKNKEKLSYPGSVDLKEIKKKDTLRVATMYGSTSYFLFRDELMGFDYEMAENLAEYLHINLKINIAKSETEMYQLLQERKVDMVCYNVIETKELKSNVNSVSIHH